MSAHKVGEVTVDVCRGGCGGVWFDNFELKKVDENFEPADDGLLDVECDPSIIVDHDARRGCPKCPDIIMMRHHFSVRRDIEVDHCPRCAGYFLDHGELDAIREQFGSEEDRRAAARETFGDLFNEQLDAESHQSVDELKRSRGFARMFRVLLPSYWLRGKQPWGAF